jgi:hypothetical protein
MTLAVAASLFVFGAGATAPPMASGSRWEGEATSTTGRTMHVVANFDAGKVSLRFGEPAACRIVAAAQHANDDVHAFRFAVSQNGGAFCKRLYPGELTITQLSTRSIGMRFDRGEVGWNATLERFSDP